MEIVEYNYDNRMQYSEFIRKYNKSNCLNSLNIQTFSKGKNIFLMIDKGLNYVYIKDKARMEFTKQFDLKLQQTIKHKKLGRDVTYEYLIRLEIYKLIKYLTGNIEYDGFKMWW